MRKVGQRNSQRGMPGLHEIRIREPAGRQEYIEYMGTVMDLDEADSLGACRTGLEAS